MERATDDAAAIWRIVSQQLKSTYPTVFDSFFCRMVPVEIDSENRIVFGVPDQFFGDWISDNYGDLLSPIVLASGVAGYLFRSGYLPKETEQEATPSAATQKPAQAQKPAVPAPQAETAAALEHKKPAHTSNSFNLHTFDNFIVSEENRYACTAAKMVAETPGVYNPLYIYGGTGVGKTHLLHAIAQYVAAHNPQTAVRYTTCEDLFNDFYDSLTNKRPLGAFRSSLRDVDILLVDDIHLLGKAPQLQEEFFNTFNALQASGKQIVLTSDKQPCEINGLEARLISRFESGMTTDIAAPEYEARFAILKMMREESVVKVKLNDSVLEYIARNIASSVRRLKGAFIRVTTYVSMRHTTKITLDEVEQLLHVIIERERASHTISIDDIQRKVADCCNISIADMLGDKRPAHIAQPRMLAMYLCRRYTKHSLPEIGQAFGRNHATIINAVKKVPALCEKSEDFRHLVAEIERTLTRR